MGHVLSRTWADEQLVTTSNLCVQQFSVIVTDGRKKIEGLDRLHTDKGIIQINDSCRVKVFLNLYTNTENHVSFYL